MRFAIYGLFFTTTFSFNDFHFTPIENKLKFLERKKQISDKWYYHLSGFIDTPDINPNEFIFEMQAVLTFVQQQDVIIKKVLEEEITTEYLSEFERNGTAAPFAFYSDLQEEIIEKLYLKLIDKNDLCNQKINNSVFNSSHNCEFSSLVYKVTEPFHMRKKIIELTYYLYFSGLEAFSKQYLKSYYPEIKIANDASKNMAEMLEKLEINYIHIYSKDTKNNLRTQINNKEDFLKLSLSTYSNLRNSLFHQNLFVAETECSLQKDINGKYLKENVRIIDYKHYLLKLCNAVILKYIGVNNPNLNCSKWHTRFPLIKSIN